MIRMDESRKVSKRQNPTCSLLMALMRPDNRAPGRGANIVQSTLTGICIQGFSYKMGAEGCCNSVLE